MPLHRQLRYFPIKSRPKTVRCLRCKSKIKCKAKGPLPHYCSQTCRQRAYEQRRYGGVRLALARDIATVKIRGAIRAEVIAVLQQAGLLPARLPPALPQRRSRPRPNLRLVDGTTPDAAAPPDEGTPTTTA